MLVVDIMVENVDKCITIVYNYIQFGDIYNFYVDIFWKAMNKLLSSVDKQ